jgi:putative hydrolase of the HAD superfamily
MPAVDRSLLRIGTYELAFEPDQPEGVVISEAVALATRFSTDDSSKFVNGVLSAMVEQVRGGGSWRNICCPLALLVDMDGVIRHWDGSDMLAADEVLGLPPGSYAAVALEPDRVRRANDGTLTDEEWRTEVAEALASEHGCDPVAALTAWGTDGFTVDEAVVDLVRAVRDRGVRTVCLSNATTRLADDMAARGLADAFAAVVSSSQVRSLKPAPAIYEAAAEAAGSAPGDCLFVDDRAENVAGALAVGMPAVRFHDAARLDATLRRVGLLPA